MIKKLKTTQVNQKRIKGLTWRCSPQYIQTKRFLSNQMATITSRPQGKWLYRSARRMKTLTVLSPNANCVSKSQRLNLKRKLSRLEDFLMKMRNCKDRSLLYAQARKKKKKKLEMKRKMKVTMISPLKRLNTSQS